MKIRQIKGRIWIGRVKVTFSRIGAYISYINFLMLILTFYTVKGHEYAPLWVFILLAIIGIVGLSAFDYFFMLPCEIAFQNEQAVKHQNPIYDMLGEMRKELKELRRKELQKGRKKL